MKKATKEEKATKKAVKKVVKKGVKKVDKKAKPTIMMEKKEMLNKKNMSSRFPKKKVVKKAKNK